MSEELYHYKLLILCSLEKLKLRKNSKDSKIKLLDLKECIILSEAIEK